MYGILAENEYLAQVPIKTSGGTYAIWFNSSPAVITDIARSRLTNWLQDNKIPLCFCLETIGLFGDSYDTDILISIIENTKVDKEFYFACNALSVINIKLLINLLNKIISEKHFSSHEAKKVLLSHGIKSNIDDEFDFFIEFLSRPEKELSENVLFLDNLTKFIGNFKLNQFQVKKLIETYKSLKVRQNYNIYYKIWEIASYNQDNEFLELVELSFLKNDSEAIHQAMSYLTCLNELNINDELSKKIDDYFTHVDEESFGLKLNYIKYYLKITENEIAYEIVFETVKKILIDLSPETINYEKYKLSFSSTDRVFDFFNIDENIIFDDSIALKLLLINTIYIPEYDKIKTKVLSKISPIKIENYVNTIKDDYVKIYIFDYLLKNRFLLNTVDVFTQYLPIFLGHHMFYDTIQFVCEDNWSDELAFIFLSNFLNYKWEQISAQMFEKYTDFYAQILTQEQLTRFEQQRDKSIHPLVNRIYKIWLEYNGLGESV